MREITHPEYRLMGSTGEANPARVLIVEDDDDVRRFMVTALTQEGYLVDQAATAWDGMRLLETHEYDVVLSDYALPGRDGVWMLTRAEAEGRLARTREVLIVTAHPAPEGAERFRVIHKPIDLDCLVGILAAIVGRGGYASANSARMDASAPSSSRRSRAKQKRM